MAYGLDFEEIYYTNHLRYDLGVLQTYKIDIDLADEKDFSIESPEPVIPLKGFWYIQGTEYGGIVDAFETDSDEESIKYTGRTFRGLLDAHIVDVEGAERTIPSKVKAELDDSGASTEIKSATISDCFAELIGESGLGDTFVVDEPDIHEDVSPVLTSYSVKQGTTLYDALMGLADSIDFSFVLTYRADHMIHITPILAQDYVDYLKGSRYEGIGFRTELDAALVNHLVICAKDDEGRIRKAHFFTDRNGGLQPYATVDEPIKDSQYIVDKSSQILFGIDEVAEYQETTDSVVENYEVVESAPPDWNTNFASYYKHENTDQYSAVTHPTGNPKAQGWYEKSGDEYTPTNDTSVAIGKQYYLHSVNEDYGEYEAVGDEVYTLLGSQPSDWNTNYSKYFVRSYDPQGQNYTLVVNPTGNPKSQNWYERDGDNYTKTNDTSVVAGKYYYTTDWQYSAVSGTSVIVPNSIYQITSKPVDWNVNYGQYYYKFWNGVEIEYRQYDGRQYESFKKMTKKPDDWDTNFSSYYRKVFKKETERQSGKIKKVLVDNVYYNNEYYTTCKADDDGKNKTKPSFEKHTHYLKETTTIPPDFKGNNCWRYRTTEVAPSWSSVSGACYTMKMSYHAPKFIVGECYRMVFDHYYDMAKSALDFFEEQKVRNHQEMELDYFVVNIGDTVGGTDEFTKTNVVGKVTNIEADIENGLIDVKYTVSIDDYTSALILSEG